MVSSTGPVTVGARCGRRRRRRRGRPPGPPPARAGRRRAPALRRAARAPLLQALPSGQRERSAHNAVARNVSQGSLHEAESRSTESRSKKTADNQ
ncbi:MAG: hypothetical protein MZV70_07895 [Desulfobacterales bacterium]|nr:hypothetical protein [Desulfobacterales bacterium]